MSALCLGQLWDTVALVAVMLLADYYGVPVRTLCTEGWETGPDGLD